MSLRNVVTSCGWFCVSRTATVPCSIPTGTVRLKRFWTAAGGAAVVRSKSLCGCVSSVSRIAPPTHQVSYPASSSFLAMLRTSRGMSSRAGKLPTEHRTPIHIQDLARNVPGERGAEEHNRARDCLGAGPPAEGDRLLDGAPPATRVGLRRHLRIHPPWRDAIHRDARGQLDGE